jgi:hypothetical protein
LSPGVAAARQPRAIFRKPFGLKEAGLFAAGAVAILEGETFFWFWIGSHDEYEKLLGGR